MVEHRGIAPLFLCLEGRRVSLNTYARKTSGIIPLEQPNNACMIGNVNIPGALIERLRDAECVSVLTGEAFSLKVECQPSAMHKPVCGNSIVRRTLPRRPPFDTTRGSYGNGVTNGAGNSSPAPNPTPRT